MNLQILVYSPLIEEEQSLCGWSKATIDYINDNRKNVDKVIHNIARSMKKGNIQQSELDDIYSEVLMYLYKADDYNLSKAVDGTSGGVVSLEGYVNVCIKYCVKRYLTTEYKRSKRIIKEYAATDGKDITIFDIIPDKKTDLDFDTVLFDLEQLCDSCEYLRYTYGADLYLIWYVRLMTLSSGINAAYEDILNVLGITKRELSSIERRTTKDDFMESFAKSVASTGVEKSIGIVEKYVYSANRIKEVIQQYN